jgi:hypothetical protein
MVRPRNLLLLACHVTNEVAQLTQGCRLIHYEYFSDKEGQAIHAEQQQQAAPRTSDKDEPSAQK